MFEEALDLRTIKSELSKAKTVSGSNHLISEEGIETSMSMRLFVLALGSNHLISEEGIETILGKYLPINVWR